MTVVTFQGKTPKVDLTVYIAPGACIIGDVDIGRDASIWFNVVVRADINRISIGERTNVQDGAVVHVTHVHPVQIGADVTIGHRAIVHGCGIGDCCLIGMGAVVLDNALIGPQALVAAGAVVRENFVVPEGTLAAGVPARIIRKLSDAEKEMLAQSAAHYVEYSRSWRIQNLGIGST